MHLISFYFYKPTDCKPSIYFENFVNLNGNNDEIRLAPLLFSVLYFNSNIINGFLL